MRINVQWLSEEKHVLNIVFHAKWDWEDFQTLRKMVKSFMSEVQHTVPIMIEYDRDADFLPANALRNFSIALEEGEPNTGMLVFVSPSQFWRVILVLLKRLLPHTALRDSHIVKTREEGLRLLRQYLETSRN